MTPEMKAEVQAEVRHIIREELQVTVTLNTRKNTAFSDGKQKLEAVVTVGLRTNPVIIREKQYIGFSDFPLR